MANSFSIKIYPNSSFDIDDLRNFLESKKYHQIMEGPIHQSNVSYIMSQDGTIIKSYNGLRFYTCEMKNGICIEKDKFDINSAKEISGVKKINIIKNRRSITFRPDNENEKTIYAYIDEIENGRKIVEVRIKGTDKKSESTLRDVAKYFEEHKIPIITKHESDILLDLENDNKISQKVLTYQFDVLKPLVEKLQYRCQVMPVEEERVVPLALRIDKLTGKRLLKSIKSGKNKSKISQEMYNKALSDSDDAFPTLVECFFLKNVSYDELKDITLKFLHLNTAVDKKSFMQDTETRYTHTVKLCLLCLLSAKKFNRDTTSLLRIINHSLNHDVGHVALAHANENKINKVNGGKGKKSGWWHPEESGRIIQIRLNNSFKKLMSQFLKEDFRREEIERIYQEESNAVVYSAKCHNKNVSDRRGLTFEAQMVKMFDKIISDFTDIFDIIYDEDKLKFAKILGIVNEKMKGNILLSSIKEFFNDDLINKAVEQLHKKNLIKNDEEENEIRYHLQEIVKIFQSIPRGRF